MAKKILIADDELDFLQMLSMRLKANKYEVIIARDGVQAVSQAFSQKPQLIILDVLMPCGDGYTVYERLKKSAHTKSTPVLFLSGLPPTELARKTEELGATGYISKPYDPAELVAKVKAIIGE
jgi:DNA-binding response OmpR family regulator